jgi:hypothetical protein
MNSYILAFLLLFTVSQGRNTDPKTGKAGTEKIVFKSTNGGQTWQDISKGLPENLGDDGTEETSFFANDKGLFIKVGNRTHCITTHQMLPLLFGPGRISLSDIAALTPLGPTCLPTTTGV